MLIAIVGCKKDDSSSSPTSSNNTTTTSHLLGSGSISFTAGSLGVLVLADHGPALLPEALVPE